MPWWSLIIALSPVSDAGYHLPDGFGFAGSMVVLMGDSLGPGRRLIDLCGNVNSPRYGVYRVK